MQLHPNCCENFCPIDLNSNLYLYEKNFAEFYRELGNKDTVAKWEQLARKRKGLINDYCYDGIKKQFYDYDFVNSAKSPIVSSAIFSLLFPQVVSPKQAREIVNMLPLLETPYGLRSCESGDYVYNYQWGDKNGWAPLHYLAIEGLKRYGLEDEANRLARKYVSLVCRNFERTNNLWEKYNIIDGTINTANEYKMPAFLGWTAGVFMHLTK